ncbi:hypothetical protein R3W88_023146 [Solanum pinnatisectum]|uniref:Uncharacterized protein n=1 Tax=Solanum pinnatisectum TaxID=50273 RepID=A0AAV9LXE4_9SOLN|nr:hypothetical protein R3W88_023146 [Solanum pinnatisectum]
MCFLLSDLFQKIAEMARSHGSLVLVGNNSIIYLVSSHPLDLGADIVMHSAAKFITRHCDLMGGVLVVTGERFFFLCSWLDLRFHMLSHHP